MPTWKEKVLAEAAAQRDADPEHMKNELDWYVGRVIFRMPTEDFIQLLDEVVGLKELFDMRLRNGIRVRYWVRDLVEAAVLEE